MIASFALMVYLWADILHPEALPEKSLDVKGRNIYRDELLEKPRLIIIANRESFRLIDQTVEVAEYPEETIWIPNISLAPSWMISPIIKPALNDIAAKVSHPVIYDTDGEWSDRLKVTSDNIYYLAVFYADRHRVKKVTEKWVDPVAYKDKQKKQQLVKEIVLAWKQASD